MDKPDDDFDQLLMRHTGQCREEALRTDGQVSAERVDSLARLAMLAEIGRIVRPSPTVGRRAMTIVLGVSLAIASVLLFAHVSETDIELNVRLSEVAFYLPERQVLLEGMVLSVLGVSGLQEIQIPSSRSHNAQSWASADRSEFSVRLLAESPTPGPGTITLGPLQLPGNTRVGLRRMGALGQYRLALGGNEMEFGVDVHGPLQFERSDGPRMEFDFISPGAVHLRPISRGIDFDLLLSNPGQTIFSTELPVRDLSLMHIEEFLSSNNPTVRYASNVLSGTLYLESLNGQEHQLRAGEVVQFDKSDGQVRLLQPGNDGISLAFAGRVRGMTTGSGESRRSLMPTWLEWLKARHGLSLLWGSAVYLFGLAIGVIRAWRTPS